MAKINIDFNNTNYQVDESSLSAATSALRQHLSAVMNGSGATINFGGTSYNIDATKLSAAKNDFVSHLGTISGSGKKVVVGGVEYGISSNKIQSTIAKLEAVFKKLAYNGDGGDDNSVVGTWKFNEILTPINKNFDEGFEGIDCKANVLHDEEVRQMTYFYFIGSSESIEEFGVGGEDTEMSLYYDGDWGAASRIITITEEPTDAEFIAWLKANAQPTSVDFNVTNKGGYLFYSFDGENYLIGYEGDDAELVLPNDYNGESYQIREGAFSDRVSLTNIYIPDSVTTIGCRAFENCTSLTSVAIPDSVTTIDAYAFSNCTSLTSVTFGDSVTSIGSYVFSGCSGLTSITIPNSVTSIGEYAFYDCTGLTSITIGDGVTTIDYSAFNGCTSLTSVTFGANSQLSTIESYAFENCTSLTSVTIPDSVTTISWYAFYGCNSLKYNIYDNGKYLGNTNNPYLFLADTVSNAITQCEIHPSTRIICRDAFENCTSLTSVTIPDSVTTIGWYAFSNCTSLTSVTFGDSVTQIGWGAFGNCESLTDITFNGTVAQWNAIEFGIAWNNSVPATYVQCSDGKVAL